MKEKKQQPQKEEEAWSLPWGQVRREGEEQLFLDQKQIQEMVDI